MGINKMAATGRTGALARLAVALGVAVGLLLGQLAISDAPQASAQKDVWADIEKDLKDLRELGGG